jgi:fumarylacetoacetate (FAA) hydrolase
VRVAHVRERGAPAGAPWRLAIAAAAPSTGPSSTPGASAWLDADVVRRRLVAADPRRAHNAALFRTPITTVDDLVGRGIRLAALADLLDGVAGVEPREDDDAILDADDLAFGPPVLQPPAFRDFYAFERHVRTMWARRGGEIPEAWYRLPIFYFSNTSELRGPDDPVWAPRGCLELDFELEVGAVVDTPAFDLSADRAAEAIGGYTVLADWSARDLQRDETVLRLGPAKGKDFATSIGPWLVTPDELADAWAPGAKAPDLRMTATVVTGAGALVEVSRGSWASAHYSFGEMLERAAADVHVRPGEILGSGTVGTGCLLEVRAETLGRWLEPGDLVTLEIERLGRLRTPIVARPAG